MRSPRQSQCSQSGNLLVLVLVFGAIFLIILTSFISSIIAQSQVVEFRFQQQQAGDIAEAGLNYYKWYLAHNPGDIGGGGLYEYTDLETSNRIGEYELAVTGNSYCGQISSIEVESTGRTDANPDAVAIINATYKQPAVAEYSFITNAGVWYGEGSVVTGPIHSNQGLRMEAAHNSLVGSGQATWDCTSSYGCNPTVSDAPGVYSSGSVSTPGLFSYPVSPVDFAGLTIDLTQLRTSALADGIYYGPTSGYGYHVIFNGNSTVDVYRVTNTYNYYSYSSTEGTHPNASFPDGERNVITAKTLIANDRPINPDCPVLFFEDKLWIEGDINGKVAVAAALNTVDSQTNIVIEGNINYVSGSDAGLLAIAQDDVDIGVTVPEDLEVSGIFIAQNGRYGRNQYLTSWFTNAYDDLVIIDSMNFLGTVVTNLRAGTSWVNGAGTVVSGIESSTSSFDRDQIDDPPPLTPAINDVYELQDWRQEG